MIGVRSGSSDCNFCTLTKSWSESHRFKGPLLLSEGPGMGWSTFSPVCDRVVAVRTHMRLLYSVCCSKGSSARGLTKPCISLKRFLHFAHGPHFKDSRLSTSEHVQSHGLSHLVRLSSLPCFSALRYSMEKSKAMRAFGSFRRKRKVRAWRSLRTTVCSIR